MKIWLPIKLHTTGGSSTFAQKFQARMKEKGHTVQCGLSSPTDYDVLLISPRAPLSLVLAARRHGKKIIHRLDGAYYPATPAGWLFPAYNAPLTAIQYFSHHTIYQSTYAKDICSRLVGPRAVKHTSVIYNGVDENQFSPTGPQNPLRQSPDQSVFFTAQQFRRADQIQPLLAALAAYQQRHTTQAILAIAGDFVGETARLLPSLQKNPSLRLLGPITNDELPKYLRAADAFAYCHPNPACPNNVLEAMACGVPIVGIADGAMPELVRHEQDGYLVKLAGDGHLFPRPFNPIAFAEAMHAAVTNQAKIGHNTRQRILAHFTLSRMLKGYQEVLDRYS